MRSLYARLHRRFGTRVSGTARKLLVRRQISNLAQRFPVEDWLSASKAAPKRLRPRIVVIGAGLGGLAAGFLLAHDYKVTVLEARERVGGRVHTLRDRSGRVAELGGELIGYAHPLWLTLAEHFGLGLSVLTREDDFASQNLELPMDLRGQSLDSPQQEELYEEMKTVFETMGRESESLSDPYEPWRDATAQQRDSISLSQWIASQPCSELAKIALETQFANDNGAPASRQSYLANLALIAGAASQEHPDAFFTQTENVRCEDGNDALATALAAAIKTQGGKVMTSHPAAKIVVQESKVVVTPAGGRAISADYAVLAVPPSAWDCITIEPPIERTYFMTMGTVIKYLSTANRRFWFDHKQGPSSASDRFGVTWEGTDNQMRGRNQKIYFNLFAGGKPAELVLQLYREKGLASVRRFYDQAVGEIYRTYPAARTGVHFVPWPLERWTWGGYSCPAPGEVCRVGAFLNRPYCNRLFFAGEHVCMPFFGYMEGALESGAMAARKILGT